MAVDVTGLATGQNAFSGTQAHSVQVDAEAGQYLWISVFAISFFHTDGFDWGASDDAVNSSLSWQLRGHLESDDAGVNLTGSVAVFSAGPVEANETFDITVDGNISSSNGFLYVVNAVAASGDGHDGTLAQPAGLALHFETETGSVALPGAPSGTQIATAASSEPNAGGIDWDSDPSGWTSVAGMEANGPNPSNVLTSSTATATTFGPYGHEAGSGATYFGLVLVELSSGGVAVEAAGSGDGAAEVVPAGPVPVVPAGSGDGASAIEPLVDVLPETDLESMHDDEHVNYHMVLHRAVNTVLGPLGAGDLWAKADAGTAVPSLGGVQPQFAGPGQVLDVVHDAPGELSFAVTAATRAVRVTASADITGLAVMDFHLLGGPFAQVAMMVEASGTVDVDLSGAAAVPASVRAGGAVTAVPSATTSWDVNLPAAVEETDEILVVLQPFSGGSPPAAAAAEWTQVNADPVFGDRTLLWFAKDTVVGDEDGTDVEFTISAAAFGTAIAVAVAGSDSPANWAFATAATGTGNDMPDPPSLNAGLGATLWLAVAAAFDDDAAFTGFPTDYSHAQLQVQSGGGTDAGNELALAARQLTAATENPGPFTLSEPENWATQTAGIGSAASAPGALHVVGTVPASLSDTERFSVELQRWADAAPGLELVGTATAATEPPGTSHVVPLPASADGDVHFAVLGLNSDTTVSPPDGTWTEHLHEVQDPGTLAVYSRPSTGGPATTAVFTSAVPETAVQPAALIGATVRGHQGQVEAEVALGISDQPNPPPATAPWAAPQNLALAVCMWRNQGAQLTAYPPGYSQGVNVRRVNTGGGAVGAALAVRAVPGGTEDPGTFRLTTGERWLAATLLLRPA